MKRYTFLGVLVGMAVIYLLSFYTPGANQEAEAEPGIPTKQIYKVDSIEGGDLLLINPENRNDNRLIEMETAFKYGVDVLPGNNIMLVTRQDGTIVDIHKKEE